MNQEKKQKHTSLQIIKNLLLVLSYVRQYIPSYLYITLGEGVGRGIDHFLDILYIRYLFNAIDCGTEFTKMLFCSFLVVLYKMLFELFNKWRLEVYVPRAKLVLHEKMQHKIYQKARSLDQSCYDDPEFYNKFIWTIRESDTHIVQIMETFGVLINRVFCSVVVWGTVATMDGITAGLIMVASLLSLVVKNKLNFLEYEKKLDIIPIDRKLEYIAHVFYLRNYSKEIRKGGIAEHLQKVYAENARKKSLYKQKHMKRIFGFSFIHAMLTQVFPQAGITCYLVLRHIQDKNLSLGDFTSQMYATIKLSWTLAEMFRYFAGFNNHSLYIERLTTFLNYEPRIKGSIEEVPPFESLTIKNLSFSYPHTREKALKDINLEIKKGETVAFVGYNGAGKTTLTKILMRLYDSDVGDVLYNGKSITQFVPERYREHVGVVFQDYQVFATTIAENVLGNEYTEEEKERVYSAVQAAMLQEKVNSLPKGIHSQLTKEFSEEGVEFSNGELQKLAIARVFASSYELIIMDEPSSSLDPIAEYELNQSILKRLHDQTIILISHRLATTQMADRIYMFDQGRIVESGSHHELMESDGKYAEMYRAQAKKYHVDYIC